MGIQYAYEYGKRWSVRTPRAVIGLIIDRMHVATPDSEICDLIAQRLANADPAAFTDKIKAECHAYALLRHAANRKLYRYVMKG